MTDPHDAPPESKASKTRSPDLIGLLAQYWWSQRWLIVKVMSIAVLTFVVVLLLVPRRYKAEVTAIVLPPRFLPEVRTQPLSVTSVKTLLSSGQLIHDVIVRLRETRQALDAYAKAGQKNVPKMIAELTGQSAEEIGHRLNIPGSPLAEYIASLDAGELAALYEYDLAELQDMSTDDLAGALESAEMIEKKTATDTVFSPLIKLYAIADSGAKAQLLDNTWAQLFEKMYDRLTRKKTSQLHESILKQQLAAQTELKDIETTIVEFKRTRNLELLLRQIEENTNSYRGFSQQLIGKQASFRLQRSRLQRLEELVTALEVDGTWIGRVELSHNQSDESHDTEVLSLVEAGDMGAAPYNASDATTEVLKAQTLISRERLHMAREEANNFYRRRPLALLETQNAQMQKDYLEAASRLQTGRVKQESLRRALVRMDAELSATERAIVLSTTLPDEALGNAIVSGRRQELSQLAGIEFKRQEINPQWETFQQQRNVTSQDLALAEGEVAVLSQRVPELEKELLKLQDTVYLAQLDEVLVKDQLQRWQDNNEQLFRSYVDINDQIGQAAQSISLMEREITDLEMVTSLTSTAINDLQQQYNQAASLLTVLELQQKAVQRNADLLLQKVQEAQIAMNEDVSDVSIPARAIAPDRHYFPRRSILLLAATFVTFVALLGLLGRKRYLELCDVP